MDMNVDKISELPEPILHSILSSMPVKFAIRTSLLSRRWINIWTRIPYLNFDEIEFKGDRGYRQLPVMRAMHLEDAERTRFVDFVLQALLGYEGNNLTTFRLRFRYDGRFHFFINQGLYFAMTRSVQELDLDFSGGGYAAIPNSGYLPFELPFYFYGYESLCILRLSFCKLNPSDFRVFMSLQILSLTRIKLTSELLMNLLKNCMVLKMLDLVKCRGLIGIIISSLNLKSLKVRDCRPLSSGINIQTPMLESFEYFGHMVSFDIGKMVCLVDVVLDFELQFEFSRCGRKLSDLLGDLDRAMCLTVCPYLIQVLPTEDHFGSSLPKTLHNLKHLTLKTGLDNNELLGITCLLKSSPNLETLTVELGLGKCIKGYNHDEFLNGSSFYSSDYWESQYPAFDSLSDHLKYVKLNGFTGWENEMELARYLLKNALVLKKMIIVVPKESYLRLDKGYAKRRSKLARKMRVFAAASPVAQVVFY